jgi:putative transposase
MRYAQRVNRDRGWHGHLWQGRYFSSALDESYLWAAIRYVERNPVRAKIVARAEDFPWSSAPTHCGLDCSPALNMDSPLQRRFAGIADWAAWLRERDAPDSLEVLRSYADKGLPCGAPGFIESLERSAGRPLRCRPRGRPPKVAEKGLRPL